MGQGRGSLFMDVVTDLGALSSENTKCNSFADV